MDVFWWGLYHGGDSRFRLPGVPIGGKLQEAFQVAFKTHPKEIKVGRELAGVRCGKKVFLGEVYDFSDPY